MPSIKMCTEKIRIYFSGNINTKGIAELTALFSRYRINIIDIDMYNIRNKEGKLIIICQCSSTTDEIDSFWNALEDVSKNLKITFSKKYINKD